MTSFATYQVLGAGAPLVSADKGSMNNRRKCVGEQMKNKTKTFLEETAIVTTGTVAAATANKKLFGASTTWNTSVNKGLKKIAKTLTERIDYAKATPAAKCSKGADAMIKVAEVIRDGAKKLGKTSTRQKVVAGIVALTAGVFLYAAKKGAYNAGQIDQQYTDKAAEV